MSGHIRSNSIECWCGKLHKSRTPAVSREAALRMHLEDPSMGQRISKSLKKMWRAKSAEDRALHGELTIAGIASAMQERRESGQTAHWNQTPERRKAMSSTVKRLIAEGVINPAATHPSPNGLERAYIEFFSEKGLDFRFVGDGQIWMYHAASKSRMNPDFINVKKRQIIEVTARCGYFHDAADRKARIKKYKDLGWTAIFLNESHLKNSGETATASIAKAFSTLKNGMTVVSVKKTRKNEIEVYDYTCEPNHNYFVGSCGVLSHNSDNSTEFYEDLSRAIQLGTNSRTQLVCPLGNMMKHHLIAYADKIGVPLHRTWSCYRGNQNQCGTCGPCTNTQRAALLAGVNTHIVYDKPLHE